MDTNPPFKSPSAFLPSAWVLAPSEEPGDIDNHPGSPSGGHDMTEGWRMLERNDERKDLPIGEDEQHSPLHVLLCRNLVGVASMVFAGVSQ